MPQRIPSRHHAGDDGRRARESGSHAFGGRIAALAGDDAQVQGDAPLVLRLGGRGRTGGIQPREVRLDQAEKRRLLKELRDRTNPLAARDRVIFELFLSTGIRLSELASLDVDDVDLDGKHIRVVGKGSVPQVKFIKSSLRTVLRAYLAERRRAADGDCRALFISSRGTRLCGRQIALRLTHWLGRAGIARRITPHGLRHTFATHLYAKTSDLLLVKRALDHRDISTTEIYTHLADEALEEAIERL